MRLAALWALAALLVALLVHPGYGIGVISIDLGTEWLKMGLVKRGVAADMVLNAESQRKTPLALSITDSERLFGSPAKAAGAKQPARLFECIQPLIGQPADSPLVQKFQKQFPQYNIEADPERKTVVFKVGEDRYAVEEFLAMLLEFARETASKAADEPINEAVILVPPFFTQAERKTVLHAADLVGLNVVQLMNDNAAVALNWGIFNKKRFEEKPQTILFYDMGAGSTTATIVEYAFVKTSKTSPKTPALKVKGTAYDRTLGGLEFDLVMREHLIKLFDEQQKGKVKARDSPRALAKLLKEANRVKEVLSANTETFAQIEGVLPDIDFKRTKVTRAELEEMCADLFDRATQPMEDVLKATDMSMDQIDQVIMYGGAQRMPGVQARLLKVTNGKELAKSINADEAGAIGGVLQAAARSKAFRLTPFNVDDAVLFPIALTYPRVLEEEEGGEKGNVSRAVFKRGARYPEGKIFTFNKHTEDFDFTLDYGDLTFLPARQLDFITSRNISRYALTGLTEAMAEHKDKLYISTKVNVRMDASGVVNVASAYALFNETTNADAAAAAGDGLADKVKKLFGFGEKENEGETEEEEPKGDGAAEEAAAGEAKPEDKEAEKAKADDTKADNTTADAAADAKKDGVNATEPPKPKDPVQVKVTLKVQEHDLDIVPLDAGQIHAMKERLDAIRKAEQEKVRGMKAKHELESTVYSMYDKLEEEHVDKVVTDEELDAIRAYQSECSDWLYGEGSEAGAELYRERLDKLHSMTKPIFHRREELMARPAAVEELRKAFVRLEKLKDRPESESHWTDDAYQRVADIVEESKKWLEDKLAEQEKKLLTEEPVFLAAELSRKAKRINRDVKALKDTPPPPPPPKNETVAEDGKNATETADEKAETGDAAKEEEAAEETKQEQEDTASTDAGADEKAASDEEAPKDDDHDEL